MSDSVCAVRPNRAQWVPEGRKLHLVDIENLCGGSHVADSEVADAMQVYCEAATVGDADHVVIACSPQLAIPSHASAGSARVLIGRGFDGADEALIAAASVTDVAHRYDEVVIGSGDHIFADIAAALRLVGVAVTVVSRMSSLASSLARVAKTVVCIPDLPQPIGEAALRKVA
jgi:hypothetical protein